jgi:hypothetical protein
MRGELLGGWRKLYIGELHKLYFSSNIIKLKFLRWMRWVWHVACISEKVNAYRVLVGKAVGYR